MERRKIRVMIVDDSMFFRASLARTINASGDMEVVAEAYDPYEARDRIGELMPDVMTLDIEMPNMNGVEFMKFLLPQCKIPVIIVSSLTNTEAEARRAGAADFIAKPASRSSDAVAAFSAEVLRVIRAAASGRRISRAAPAVPSPSAAPAKDCAGLIAIGASTGGTQATAKILRGLPADMPGIVVAQHMPPDFTRIYADNLDLDCAMTVREAKDGDVIEKGRVLIAPGGNRHMEVKKRGGDLCVRLISGDKVNGHCPSVDVLFASIARLPSCGSTAGVLLTGMGADGARGLLAMRERGAYTIGQDEKSCVVYGMPREAFAIGAVARQAPLDGIASLLTAFARGGRR